MNGFELIFFLIGLFSTIIWITKLFKEAIDGTWFTLRKLIVLLGISIFFKKKIPNKKDDIHKIE